jgi:hypothetical protein
MLNRTIALLIRCKTFKKVCHTHIRALASRFDLITNHSDDILRQRLDYLYQHRDSIEDVKVDQRTYVKPKYGSYSAPVLGVRSPPYSPAIFPYR